MALVVFSVLSMIAVPSVKGILEHQKLNADANQLATVLRTARSEAILHEKPVTIKFYPADNSYKVVYNNVPNTSNIRYRLNTGITYIGTTTFPASAEEGVKYCSFYTSGAPSQGGTVTFINSNGTKRYIIVNGAAGRVRVSNKPPANWE